MNIEQVTAEFVAILKEFQTQLGHDDADTVTPKTRPFGDLKGFQTDLTPTIARRVARRLGHPIPEDVVVINVFYSEDGRQKLTVEEAAKRFIERYGPKGSPDERPSREEKDHRESPQGGAEDGGAHPRAGCEPNGAASARDLRN
jgi:hypothetical protein